MPEGIVGVKPRRKMNRLPRPVQRILEDLIVSHREDIKGGKYPRKKDFAKYAQEIIRNTESLSDPRSSLLVNPTTLLVRSTNVDSAARAVGVIFKEQRKPRSAGGNFKRLSTRIDELTAVVKLLATEVVQLQRGLSEPVNPTLRGLIDL